ncbi:MAG: DUF2764 domain-containing protein [Treponema sp.]|nr:DUF2764 domain-containing protein [Treponema sp.]
MGAYYYFVAQLPSLVYGQEPPMSSARFRDLAQGQLSAEDNALLGALDSAPSGPSAVPSAAGCDFIDKWRDWERALRLNLARLRSLRLKREGTADPPPVPADAAGAAQQALAASESPLEAEALLDRARWSAIEQIQGISYFDRNTVFAYLLKLLIMERSASFKVETGFAEYKSLYASILERVRPGAGESK